jgi:hypothetical protein
MICLALVCMVNWLTAMSLYLITLFDSQQVCTAGDTEGGFSIFYSLWNAGHGST